MSSSDISVYQPLDKCSYCEARIDILEVMDKYKIEHSGIDNILCSDDFCQNKCLELEEMNNMHFLNELIKCKKCGELIKRKKIVKHNHTVHPKSKNINIMN